MIAVDTNILVYAHRRDSRWHDRARDAVAGLAERNRSWAIPWPCVHEFLAIATHPRIYDPPSTPDEALRQLDAWLESPRLELLAECDGYHAVLRSVVTAAAVQGPRVHDARIAALCQAHGVSVLWTADRDFSRFARLRTANPLTSDA